MKKKVLLLLILLLHFIVGCGNKSNDDDNCSLLIALVNYNFKIGATYDGVAIFDDGSVYTRYLSTTKSDYNSSMGSYSINTKSGLEKLYLEKGIRKEGKISKKDIASINYYVNIINTSDVDANCDSDGNKYSTLYVVKNDELLKLNVSDCEKNTSNRDVEGLMDIIDKVRK